MGEAFWSHGGTTLVPRRQTDKRHGWVGRRWDDLAAAPTTADAELCAWMGLPLWTFCLLLRSCMRIGYGYGYDGHGHGYGCAGLRKTTHVRFYMTLYVDIEPPQDLTSFHSPPDLTSSFAPHLGPAHIVPILHQSPHCNPHPEDTSCPSPQNTHEQ